MAAVPHGGSLRNPRSLEDIMKKLLLIALAGASLLPLAAGATEYRVVERPRQECWNEQVANTDQGIGGAILGGLAGGIIGNQVGKGNGRTVATAVGAMTGAVVGDRMAADSAPSYRTVQRCRTVMDRVREPVVYAPPQPVYVQPVVQPTVIQPVEVVEQPVYYLQAEPRYRREHWRHGWREHHRHHDDDD
jgi:uncharacterized protein YcfJ